MVPSPEAPDGPPSSGPQVPPAASISALYAHHVDAVSRSPAHRGSLRGDAVALTPEMFAAVLVRRRRSRG
ncbi:hypothetical protein AB0L40_16730 [Patulibacter sp. NPDC049589]|uniref:hypothetical protein n=1 Tax=Patulibacter sp. NPDC049589 TaxID=3154731 RepID=UPI00341A647B